MTYARKYGKSLRTDLSYLFEHLDNLTRIRQHFTQSFQEVLATRKSKSSRAITSALQAAIREAYSVELDAYGPGLRYGIPELADFAITYHNIGQELEASLSSLKEYDRAVAADRELQKQHQKQREAEERKKNKERRKEKRDQD